MNWGTLLIIFGLGIVFIGVLWNAGFTLGQLPGDLTINNGPVTIYVPLTSSILLSIIFTIAYWIYRVI
jgi:hypothetical protein